MSQYAGLQKLTKEELRSSEYRLDLATALRSMLAANVSSRISACLVLAQCICELRGDAANTAVR